MVRAEAVQRRPLAPTPSKGEGRIWCPLQEGFGHFGDAVFASVSPHTPWNRRYLNGEPLGFSFPTRGTEE